MLAAKRSLGNLRCSSFATTASTAPALPSQSRSLMSAVLLSRSQFERKTVKQLQEELGERGLSTRGRKNILVDRLLESVSKNTVGSSVASASSPAAFSTSAVKKAAPVASKPEVETPAGEAQGDTITAAPGIIVEKKDAAEAAENADEVPGGVIEMPNAVFLPLAEKESQEAHAELMIPTSPDELTTNEDYDPFTQPFTMHPSWITQTGTSSSDVHNISQHTGDVVDDPDSRSSEPRSEREIIDTTFVEDAFANLGIKVQRKAKKAQKAGSVGTVLKELGLNMTASDSNKGKAKQGSEKQEKFKFEDRPLDAEEQTGVYVLLGIVAGGFGLSSLLARKGKVADDHDKKDSKH